MLDKSDSDSGSIFLQFGGFMRKEVQINESSSHQNQPHSVREAW